MEQTMIYRFFENYVIMLFTSLDSMYLETRDLCD